MNDVRLNRRFVETDDDEEASQLFSLLFNAVARMRRNHPDTVVDPDGITSEVFAKAFKKRKHIQKPEKLLEWLITAAKHLMIDKIRRARTQVRRLTTSPTAKERR